MDAYSFGTLCLWLLFYNTKAYQDRNFKTDLLDLQFSEKEVLNYASGLLEATADPDNWEKDKLQQVFKSTLGRDPVGRTSDFNKLLELLSLRRLVQLLQLNQSAMSGLADNKLFRTNNEIALMKRDTPYAF